MGKTLIAAILMVLIAISCSRDVGPSESDIEQRLAVDLPHPWQITSLDVEASENVGTKVEPVVKSRFKAKLKLVESTYFVDSNESAAVLLRPVLQAGDERELYGVATSVMKAGAWQTAFDFENDPLRDSGEPRTKFTGRTVVLGTDEETNYRTEIEERQRQQEAEARAGRERNRAIIISALTGGQVLPGEMTSDNSPFHCRLQFTSFDRATGEAVGQNRWVNSKTGELKPPNSVHALLTDDTLQATEQVKGSETGDDFTMTYSLRLSASQSELEGQYFMPMRTGPMRIRLK